MKKIVCVCTGNTCRSPMAAAFLKRALPDREVSSAGLHASPGQPATPEAVQVMRERGIDISGHRSRPFSCGMADGAVLVALTAAHADRMRALCPGADVIRYLGGADVPDPFGGSLESYRKTAFLLESGVGELVNRLKFR
ncbi:MAG: low molecular weight phosphatase family protein [Clostridiales bacterium]|jgi:protein-tyrosine-phosphatase|nr:low molecular weight phosphatase family protein [Clostridiales bacterium]